MINWLRLQKSKYELKQTKKQFVSAMNENIEGSQRSVDEISKILIDFKKHKYNKHDSFLNLCIFSDIVTIDLTILLEKTTISKHDQERRLYARVLAVIIIDYLDNISVLIGKDCVFELKNNGMTQFIEEFRFIHKKFSDFKKANERLLREIRNNTIAHKCKDALKLNDQINNIDVEMIINFGFDLKIYSKEFVDISTKVIYYIADYMREGRKI